MRTVIIIGGGAAGLIAGAVASQYSNNVILLEKNEKLGKKIYITGKGRCNITNNVPVDEFINNVIGNPKFVFSALNRFSPEDLVGFLTENGLKVKFERGNRVFPESDKASDVTKTFERVLMRNGVDVRLNCNVTELIVESGVVRGVKTEGGEIFGDSVIVCTGGISYPATGSTGDGYLFAESVGHDVVTPKPSLVGLTLKGNLHNDLQGLALKNVTFTAKVDGKIVFSDFGEMLFTHFGVSGPIVLSCSAIINKYQNKNIQLFIDLKPALSEDVLDARLTREFDINRVKTVENAIRSLLPKNLVEPVLKRANVQVYKKCAEITKAERLSIINVLKNFELKFDGLRPITEAIVTAGGVNVREINPKTMESKIVKGLFFAGEVIDIDAYTGGFNLQLAFSTGFVAGENA